MTANSKFLQGFNAANSTQPQQNFSQAPVNLGATVPNNFNAFDKKGPQYTNAPSQYSDVQPDQGFLDGLNLQVGQGTPRVGDGFDFGFNKGTFDAVGSGLGGLGQLAQGYAAIKGLGIAKDQLSENRRQYDQNFANQVTTTNNAIQDSNTQTGYNNAWLKAQGRSDFGKLANFV